MQTSRRILGCALALALAACGGQGKDDGKGGKGGQELASCMTPKLKECAEYNAGNRALGDAHLQKLCSAFEGTFAITPCPAADRLGVCVKAEGSKVYYQGYAMTAEELRKSCTVTDGAWRTP